jgi:hypothetical protein
LQSSQNSSSPQQAGSLKFSEGDDVNCRRRVSSQYIAVRSDQLPLWQSDSTASKGFLLPQRRNSLKELPGFDKLSYDFMAPVNQRADASKAAVEHWHRPRQGAPSRTGDEVLITSDGKIQDDAVRSRLERRDDRPITIKE